MIPLEKMSRARWARVVRTSAGQVKPFDELPESVRRNMMEDDKVALLALAGMEWPSNVTQAGVDTIVQLSRYGEVADETTASHVFHAMLRAIAENKS